MGPKKNLRSSSASRTEERKKEIEHQHKIASKMDENEDLNAHLLDALENIDKLNEKIRVLQIEKSGLQETVQIEGEQFQREKECMQSEFHRTLNDKDRQLGRLTEEIRDLHSDLEIRDCELQRLNSISMRNHQQHSNPQYNVPLPEQVLFDGKISYSAFIRQFTTLAEACGWNEKEKAFRLLNSLRDEAAEFVFNEVSPENQQSFCFLQQSLAARFLQRRSTASYLMELESVKLHSREKLVEYVADIKRLVRKGYPTADNHTISAISLRHFIRGLGDPQMALAVGMKDPNTIEEAREILETYYSLRDKMKTGNKVRMVKQGKSAEQNVSQAQFSAFQKEIEKRFAEILSAIKAPEKDSQQGKFKKREISMVECYKCHNLGHYARECPDLHSEQDKKEN